MKVGIDIYLEWDGMTPEDKDQQGVSAFSTTNGATGYLREAYHGEPYATQILVREAFEADDCRAQIPAATLRERMTNVTEPVYGATGGHEAAKVFGHMMQQIVEAGNDPSIQVTNVPTGSGQTAPMTVEEAVAERARKLYDADEAEVENVLKSFWDFVELAERKERETGKPCTVFAWY